MEETDNGVPYVEELAGSQGMRFALLPIKGVHTKEQVEEAKRELKRDRDVVGAIKVRWT